jgi:hypothetical protein
MTPTKKWTRRKYQQVALVAARKARSLVLFWARQCRKSTTLGDLAFDEMAKAPGKTVIGASASLLTGSELISKAVSATDQAILAERESAAMEATLTRSAKENGLNLVCASQETGKEYKSATADDFKDLYKAAKLELRLYHDRNSYSRTLIIAPNPATARGWTGKVIRDEAGFTRPEVETALQIATKPIADTDPTFQIIYASNLPGNNRHPFFQMTIPPPEMLFPPKAEGHFYRGTNGVLIHRVSLADAYAAGHVLYDMRAGDPMTYEQFLADPANKLGIDESYLLNHTAGGDAAIDLFAMLTSQRRGVEKKCSLEICDLESDFQRALDGLRGFLTGGEVGIGVDPATTTKGTSNPTAVTVAEREGNQRKAFIFVYKQADPKVARERLARVIKTVASRPSGPARRMCLEATSEVFWARETAQDLGGLIPIELVDVRRTVEPIPAGVDRAPNYKNWLSELYAAAVNGNLYSLPPGDYTKDDQMLVVKSAGLFSCEPQADGKHGDTFISGMMADWALNGQATGAIYLFPTTKQSLIFAGRADRTVFS